MTQVRLTKKTYKNKTDTDVYIRDAYGNEHVIYPKQEKVLLVLRRSNKDDRTGTN